MKNIVCLFLFLLSQLSFAKSSHDNPRAGIVISKASFTHHWGVTQMSAHGWGGVVNLAGIPYSCFFAEDLISETDLSNYDCLIFSQCTYLSDKTYNEIVSFLKKYISGGGNIIVDGLIGHQDENTKPRDHSELDNMLGIKYLGFYGDSEFRIKVKENQQFITRSFSIGEFITQHLAGGLNIQDFTGNGNVLLELTDEKESYPFLTVNTNPGNRIVIVNDFATWSGVPSIFRNVHPQVFYNNRIYDILIESVYWSVYGPVDTPFPSLQVSNADLTAIIRLDADASGNLNAQIQTINYLIDIAEETGVVPVYAWVSSTAASAGWQDIAPLGKRLESVGGQIGTHSKFHNIDQEMTIQRWKEELDDAKYEIEFNMADYGHDIGKVNWFINPGNTIHMSDYGEVAKRFTFYMTHGFEQDMPIGFGNFTWYNENEKNFVVLENTPSPDYQWFYDPTWSYTTQQITAYQENIFDHLYKKVQRGVIFNQMWHDYSITSQPQYGKDRIMNKNNIAMYDAIKAKFKNSNIYSPEPEDLRNKICIMAQSDYNWSVKENEIMIQLDLSNVNLDSVQAYTGGMGIRINNSNKYIQKVTIDGNEHYAFSSDVVILPNLSGKNAEIKILLGDHVPDVTRLEYISNRMPSIKKTNGGISFNLLTKSFGKFRLLTNRNSVPLNADGFTTSSKSQNEINGYVTSDRDIKLKPLSNNEIVLISSTMKITDISESGRILKLQVRSGSEKKYSELRFIAKKAVNSITLNDEFLNIKPVGENYFISVPAFNGEKELSINLK